MNRTVHRIQFRLADRPVIELWPIAGETREASLANLSEGGASVLLKGPVQGLNTRRPINCKVTLDDNEPLECRALIKRQQHLARIDETRLGLEFQDLPERSIRELFEVVMRWQRHYLRTGVGC